jgi:tRNA(Ile2) C34 agmatinyltransferase TiaS
MTTLTAPLPFTLQPVRGLTLEQRLDRAWAELRADHAADCPVCGERMTPAGDAGACRGCGSRLS